MLIFYHISRADFQSRYNVREYRLSNARFNKTDVEKLTGKVSSEFTVYFSNLKLFISVSHFVFFSKYVVVDLEKLVETFSIWRSISLKYFLKKTGISFHKCVLNIFWFKNTLAYLILVWVLSNFHNKVKLQLWISTEIFLYIHEFISLVFSPDGLRKCTSSHLNKALHYTMVPQTFILHQQGAC